MDQDQAGEQTSLRLAMDNLPLGVATFDAQLRLTFCNVRYRLLLDLPADLWARGTPMQSIVAFCAERGDFGPGDAAAITTRRVQQLTSESWTVSRRLAASGQMLEFQSSHLPDGGLVISFADVTGRVRAEAALERANHSLEERVAERTAALTQVNAELELARAKADTANRDKTRFLAAASHDLLQPLNAARLYTSTLVDRAGGTGLGDLAHSIEASLSAVEEIMSALLDISRIDSGAIKPSPTLFNIADLIKKAGVEFQPQAQEKAIALRLVPASGAVTTDRTLLARVVQNLVSNAIKYTRPGGKVLVGFRRKGNRLRLDIIDTGIGINKDQQALIFAEFSRLERGARMAQGLGLGLSIVQRLVATLGLSLELESVEGKGSRFSLLLPLARTILPAPSDPVPAQPAPRPGALDLRVLCVDNERAILDAMQGLLTGWGCDVRTARSLKDIARDRTIEGWLPDLVLMDYHLDQTSGLDAIQWLRHNVGGHLPAALVTADRSEAVRLLAHERGIAVITKPVKPAALRATITSLASRRPAPAMD